MPLVPTAVPHRLPLLIQTNKQQADKQNNQTKTLNLLIRSPLFMAQKFTAILLYFQNALVLTVFIDRVGKQNIVRKSYFCFPINIF